MKNRLQIKYYIPSSFPYEREEAVDYIENLFATNNAKSRTSLPAEPIAVFYGNDIANANVILAIGRGGDGKNIVNNVPYFLIDTAKMNEVASEKYGVLDEVKKIAEQAVVDIIKIKKDIEQLQRDIQRIDSTIGNVADNEGHGTVYGYINSNIGKIMGGAPIDGLSNINAIGNAIKRLRLRITNNANSIVEINTRMNSIDERMDILDGQYETSISELENRIVTEINDRSLAVSEEAKIRVEEDTKLRNKINDEVSRAQGVEAELRKDIDANKKACENENAAIRSEFVVADDKILQYAKDYTNAREVAITSAYQVYSDKAEMDAVNASKVYTNDAIVDAKNYALTVTDNLKQELVSADDNLRKNLTVTSKNKSLIVGSPTIDGTDVYVNVDGQTIVQDGATGQLKVASAALVQYTGANAVEVSGVVDGIKTISLKINENEQILSNDSNGLLSTLSLKWVKGEDNGGKEQIQLLGKDPLKPISTIDVAEFIKDGMLQNVTLNTDNPNNPKLVFVFNSSAGVQTIEVPVKDLLYVYEAGKGLELSNSIFSVKLSDTNENRFLTVADDGVKLSGIETFVNETKAEVENAYKNADSKIITDLTETKNRVSVSESEINTLKNKLTSEVGARETADASLQGQIDSVNVKINGVVNDYKSADEVVKTDLTALINSNTDKINVLNSGLNVDGSVKDMIFKSVAGKVITNISPADAQAQSLIRKIDVNGTPYFYASNNTSDMMHGNLVLSDIIEMLVSSNNGLVGDNTHLKEENALLKAALEEMKVKMTELEGRLDEVSGQFDMEAIKSEIIPEAISGAKQAIISPEVFKGEDMELEIFVIPGERVTYGFADDALFMADYNEEEVLPDEPENPDVTVE